ncbi:uncharacterized protein DNG_03926 [Cephalotrichum gorgonifer]|uniref:Uncharacterized protein n=1 Tax=Cephalotrichum gorgonifer TaxID=2041049 RepID=A0AAE8MX27_9PEZI|nr:uncharacterized protein DNG_03926 [Cephalotrichum gorgonifer]
MLVPVWTRLRESRAPPGGTLTKRERRAETPPLSDTSKCTLCSPGLDDPSIDLESEVLTSSTVRLLWRGKPIERQHRAGQDVPSGCCRGLLGSMSTLPLLIEEDA